MLFIPKNLEPIPDMAFEDRLICNLNITPPDSKFTRDPLRRYDDYNDFKAFRLISTEYRESLFTISFTSIASGNLDLAIDEMMQMHSARHIPLKDFIRNVRVHQVDPSYTRHAIEELKLSDFQAARQLFAGLHNDFNLVDNGRDPVVEYPKRLAGHFVYGDELDHWNMCYYSLRWLNPKQSERTSPRDKLSLFKNCQYECSATFYKAVTPSYNALSVETLRL